MSGSSERNAKVDDSDDARRRVVLGLGGLLVVVMLAAVGWLVATGLRTPRVTPRAKLAKLLTIERDFPPEGRFPNDPYVGSHACRECHPGETAAHARSGHASTLRPAARAREARSLDGLAVADPEMEGVKWRYQMSGDALEVEREHGWSVERWVADYAFGSGHHVVTFVTLLDQRKPALLEHRLSYYATNQALGLTPGQDAESRTEMITPHGNESTPANTLKCFRCHATELSARKVAAIDPVTMIPNVSCERCHGPGRAHVDAARRKADAAELVMPFGNGRWTAESLHLLCGSCHRHPSKAQPGQIRKDDTHLARFQPVGIMQSACYRASGDSFQCVTCHDPHARTSTDRATYDLVCMDCHGGRAGNAAGAEHRPVRGRACPRSPAGKCVDCHMPRVDAGQYVLFTDHWIRVRDEREEKSRVKFPAADLDLANP